MSFLHPYILIALVLPLLLAGLFISLRLKAGKAWRKLVSPAHVDELVNHYPAWKTVLSATLALLALTFLILGLARPINGYSETGGVVSGRNLIIALDVSRSMETKDVSPSRLAQAKAAATELINALPSDKIGLIIFSGDADLVVPLTYDHAALLETVEQVDLSWMEYGGTNLSLVLDRALQDFKRSAPDGTNALVILSDGEDTEDAALQTISQKAVKRNLRVITVGVGTMTGDVIPDAQGENGIWKDAHGKHVISKLQPKNLSKLAELTGGDFMVMGSGTDLSEFARLATAKIDRHEEETAVNKVPNDLFTYFAVTALILLLAAIIVPTDWRLPRRANVVLLVALAVGLAPQTQAADKGGKTEPEEVEEILEANGVDCVTPAQHYANGIRCLQEKKTDKAKEEFSRALLSDDQSLQAASLLALGNISSQAAFDKLKGFYEPKEGDEGEEASATTEDLEAVIKDLEGCMTFYQDALAADPKRNEARVNAQRLQGLVNSLRREIKRQQDQAENEEERQEKESQGQQDNKDKKQQQNQQGKQNQQNQKQQGQNSQQNQQQQQGQQQQGQKQQGKQQKQDKQQGQKQDKQDQQQQQQEQQEQQEGQDQQQQPEQPKSERQDKLEDLNDSLQDEIDRLKQKRQEQRNAQDQLKDAKDLVKDLLDELNRLKNQKQDESKPQEDKDQQEGKDKKDGKPQEKEDGEQQDKPGQNKQQGGEDGQQQKEQGKPKKDLDKAMDLTRQLEQELRRMKEEAEDEQSLTPEEQEELEKSRELIRNLREQIRLLKDDQKKQEEADQKQGKQEEQAAALDPEKERERAEERADNILKMSLDEEKGSPIPHFQQNRRNGGDRKRRPLKDY